MAATRPEPLQLASHGVYRVLAYGDGDTREGDDLVAEECPVAITYNRRSYAVMLATPADLEAYALGFSLSEGVIDTPSQLLNASVVEHSDGLELRLLIDKACMDRIPDQSRRIEGRSGCGICGARSLERMNRRPDLSDAPWSLSPDALDSAAAALEQRQILQHVTGAVHAAAFAEPGGGVLCVMEDVGRHNALDKLIGAIHVQRVNPARGFVLVTSRASYEMVQKAASVGIPMLAAVSAPTGLAIRIAESAGMTLLGFTRPPNRYVIYSGAHRIRPRGSQS